MFGELVSFLKLLARPDLSSREKLIGSITPHRNTKKMNKNCQNQLH
jgi:hypothetical protein